MRIFFLIDPEDEKANVELYFSTWSMKEFKDMLHQLVMISEERDKFDCMVQDLTGVMADNPLRREQFWEWKPNYEKRAKTKYLTNSTDPDMTDDQKFYCWLYNFC